jgi:hypothetical protein
LEFESLKRLLKAMELALDGDVEMVQDLSGPGQLSFKVTSQAGQCKSKNYFVYYYDGYWICSECWDFRNFSKKYSKGEFGSFTCKHVSACQFYLLLVMTGQIQDEALKSIMKEVINQDKKLKHIMEIEGLLI